MEPLHTTLGKSGLKVSRIAIGSSYGINSSGLVEAFEQGVNFFYFGSLRTDAMALAVRKLAPSRERLVIAIQSYARWSPLFANSVNRALLKLGIDFADILILGKVDKPLSPRLIETALQLKSQGKIRHLAVSAHKRSMFKEHIDSGTFDIIMTRYNAAHTGSETEVFPFLPKENRPGVISYTATRWGTLLKETVPGEKKITAEDCYRFVLSHPKVDVCMTGPANRDQLNQAIAAWKAPAMSDEELAWMRRVGAIIHQHPHHNRLLRALIFD